MSKNLILAVSFLLISVGFTFGQTVDLKLKKPIERVILAGETHTYEVILKKSEFMQVRVEQKGIDITLSISSVGTMDSPNGEYGFETLSVIADFADTYIVEVNRLDQEGNIEKGKYSIELLEKRKTIPKDLDRVAAEASFAQGKSFYNNEEYAQAYKEFDKLIPIWRKLGDKYMEAMSIRYLRWQWENLGEETDSPTVGDLNTRLRSLLDEVIIYQALALRREEAGILSELGEVYTKLNEYMKLVESFEKAAAIYKELGEEKLAKEALDKTKDYVKFVEEEKIKIETEKNRKTQVKLGQKVEFVVQADREGEFIISPDNKFLANKNGFGDKGSLFVSLWEITTGKMLRIFKSEDSINKFEFTNDSKSLVIKTDKYIKTFSIITGEETDSVENGDIYNSCSKKISPDGKFLASHCGPSNKVDLTEIKSRSIVKNFEIDTAWLKQIQFSPDGNVLVIWANSYVNVFDVKTGNKLKVLKLDYPSYRFYENNKESVSIDLKKAQEDLIELKRKEFEFVGIKFLENNEIQAFLQNLTGETVKSLKLFSGEENIITNLSKIVKLSDDGRLLVTSSGFVGRTTTLSFYESDNFTKISTISFNTNLPSSFWVNNGLLCTLMDGGYPMIWNLSSGGFIQLKTRNDFTECDISRDGNKVVLSDGISKATEKLVETWDLRSNTKISTYTSSYPHNVIDFLPDNNTLAICENSGEKEYSINLIDVTSGKKIRTLAQSSSSITGHIFDDEQKIFAYFDDSDKMVKVLDVKTGNILFQFPNEFGENFYTMPDIQGIKGGRFRSGSNSLTFSSDGKKLLISTEGGLIRVFDLVNGKLIGKVQTDYSNYLNLLSHWGLHLSPDEKNLIFISVSDNSGDFWNLETGKKIKTVKDYYNDNKTIETSDGEGQSIAFSSAGKLLANLYSFEDGGWLVVTPEGLFDGTPNAWQKMIWRFDNNTFSYAPVEAFFKEFYRPGLLQDIYNSNEIEPPKVDLSKIDIRQPVVKISAIDGKTLDYSALLSETISSEKKTIQVKVEIADNISKDRFGVSKKSSGANDVRLFRNGSLVKLWEKNVFELSAKDGCKQIAATKDLPRKAVCETDVQITADKNEFSAYAFNHDNVKSNDAIAEIKGAETLKRKGKLQILSVGVNEYQNKDYNLKFAVADAVDFGAELRKRQKNLNNFDAPEVVGLTDKDATKANILYALERFAKGEKAVKPSNISAELDAKFSKIEKTQPEDVLMIYFAGHGTAAKDRFYLIPTDGFPTDYKLEESFLSRLQSQSISDLELEAVLRDLDAGQIFLIVDACNSGQALESEEKRRGPMNSRGLAQLAFEKGMYILTAAQSFQAALEVSKTPDGKKIEHGLLTFSLLDGFANPNADADADKKITEREWFSFAVAEVPRMQLEEMQKRSGVYMVNGDKEKDANKRALQTPRVFYRRETSANPFVVSSF